jgi:hypothetical protein
LLIAIEFAPDRRLPPARTDSCTVSPDEPLPLTLTVTCRGFWLAAICGTESGPAEGNVMVVLLKVRVAVAE